VRGWHDAGPGRRHPRSRTAGTSATRRAGACPRPVRSDLERASLVLHDRRDECVPVECLLVSAVCHREVRRTDEQHREPAVLAEGDSLFGTGGLDPIDLNPRRARCGPAHL
jgi:hypothetical protein